MGIFKGFKGKKSNPVKKGDIAALDEDGKAIPWVGGGGATAAYSVVGNVIDVQDGGASSVAWVNVSNAFDNFRGDAINTYPDPIQRKAKKVKRKPKKKPKPYRREESTRNIDL